MAEDVKTRQQQCHICGKWYELLSAHVSFTHKISPYDYKREFGLLINTALQSMRIRQIHSETMLGLRRKHIKYCRKFKRNNVESANRKGIKKAEESANRYGVCDLQVANKIIKLKEKLGKTPALTEVIKEYGGGFAMLIHNRYQSYVSYVTSLELTPVVSKKNPKYSRDFFIEKGKEILKKGKKLSIKENFTSYEQKRIYHFFDSQGGWRRCVLKTIKT